MRLFASSRRIGIQCTDGSVRAGRVEVRRGQRHFRHICDREVSLKALSGEEIAMFPKECGGILREELLKCGIPRGHAAALLLDPADVYATILALPALDPRKTSAMVRMEVEHLIPERFDDLTVVTRPLATTADGVQMGVAAIRTDILESRLDIAREAGLRVDLATTAPILLARGLPDSREATTVLLAHMPVGKDATGTITLLRHGWPLDEQVVLQRLTDDAAVALTRELAIEYLSRGLRIDRVAFRGDDALADKLRDAFLQPLPAQGSTDPIPFERIVLAPFEEESGPGWEGILAACALPSGHGILNFAPPTSTGHTVPLAVAGSLACMALAAVLALPLLAPAPPPSRSPSPLPRHPTSSSRASSALTGSASGSAASGSTVIVADCDQALREVESAPASSSGTALRDRFAQGCAGRRVVTPLSACSWFPAPFADIGPCGAEGHAAAELQRLGIIAGYADGTFRGERSVNRVEAAAFLLRTCPSSSSNSSSASVPGTAFSDVDRGAWYAPFVLEAVSRGFVTGDAGRDTFRPADGVTRAEFLKMLSGACGLPLTGFPNASFTDVRESDWFAPFAPAAAALRLFPVDPSEPADGALHPSRPLTRNETALALYQYLRFSAAPQQAASRKASKGRAKGSRRPASKPRR